MRFTAVDGDGINEFNAARSDRRTIRLAPTLWECKGLAGLMWIKMTEGIQGKIV